MLDIEAKFARQKIKTNAKLHKGKQREQELER